jgi:hypothetical protein
MVEVEVVVVRGEREKRKRSNERAFSGEVFGCTCKTRTRGRRVARA